VFKYYGDSNFGRYKDEVTSTADTFSQITRPVLTAQWSNLGLVHGKVFSEQHFALQHSDLSNMGTFLFELVKWDSNSITLH
jgi:hypothetical protein